MSTKVVETGGTMASILPGHFKAAILSLMNLT